MSFHPFFAFRHHMNSLFDDFHSDFFNDEEPWSEKQGQGQAQAQGQRADHQKRLQGTSSPSSAATGLGDSQSDRRLTSRHPHGSSLWQPSASQGQGWLQLFPSASQVKIDLIEHSDRYIVQADLPGVDRKDIKLTVNDGFLTVSGERRNEFEESNQPQQEQQQLKDSNSNKDAQSSKDGKFSSQTHSQPSHRWVRREVSYGSVQRTIKLPHDCDASKVKAKHEGGVLRVILPKLDQKQKQQNQITIE